MPARTAVHTAVTLTATRSCPRVCPERLIAPVHPLMVHGRD